MRRVLAGFGLAGALAIACAPVRAQSPLEPPDLSRYLRWGPVRARPGLLLTNIGYDNNGYYNTLQPQQGDYTATLSPRLDGIVLFGSRAFLTFKEQLDFTVYQTYRNQNYVNQLGSGRLTVPFKKLGLYVDGTLNDTKERPADAMAIRTDVRELGLGTGILFTTGWRSDAEVGVFRRSFGYTNATSGNIYYSPSCPTVGCANDRTERGTRFMGRYLLFGRTRLTLEWTNRDITFSNASIGRDATQKRLVPGLDFGLGGRLTGTARFGWAHLDAKSPTYPDYNGPVAEARLAYRFGSGTTLQGGGLRDIGFSTYLNTGYYENATYDLRVIQYFNRIVGVEAGAGRGRGTFPANPPYLPVDRVDHSVQFDGGLRLRFSENELGRRVEYSIKLTHWSLTSNYPYVGQSRTTLGVNAIVGY